MAALDQCHHIVVRALEKDGWQVRPHGKRLETKDRRAVTLDIRARKGRRQIYVEIKCFPDPRDPERQYHAIGQYLICAT
ncbi:MAG: element excision factor XisH family protein [Aggregatilineales bacterium]